MGDSEIAAWQVMSLTDFAQKGRRRTRLLLLLLAGACAYAPHLRTAAAGDKESLIKAGFIAKFPAYITWPSENGLRPSGSFRYCVLGPDDIVDHLRSVVTLSGDQPPDGKVRVIERVSTSIPCDVLFIPDRAAHRITAIKAALGRTAVLLIGETPGLARQGAHINLFRADCRYRFRINRGAIRESGLRVSFRLLELAEVID